MGMPDTVNEVVLKSNPRIEKAMEVWLRMHSAEVLGLQGIVQVVEVGGFEAAAKQFSDELVAILDKI